MNNDEIPGLFWEEGSKVPRGTKPKPPKPKAELPPRPWEEPGFLPKLGTRLYMPPLFGPGELEAAQTAGERLVYDSEIYPNYYLVAFMSIKSGKAAYFEMTPDKAINIPLLKWVVENFLTIGFNSNEFDNTILALALEGHGLETLNRATQMLIKEQIKAWVVMRSLKVQKLSTNHIDLYNVAPLDASLKIYGGRLHVPRMQDLPFKFDTLLTEPQIDVVRDYCVGSDLVTTAFLYKELEPHIALREKMSLQFGTDLRSKSDAQVAEAVIVHELTRINFTKPERVEIPVGTSYKYKVPDFVTFKTPIMQNALNVVAKSLFVVGESGYVNTPPEIETLEIPIGNGIYKMGIGGLHSQETTVAHVSDDDTLLLDRDVASYYPSIILKLGLFPQHLGLSFLTVYKSLVDRRLEAKAKAAYKTLSEIERTIWKVITDTLKITTNGSFGKFGNKYSVLYSPDLLTQVTITGQLCLLMLIERAEIAGLLVCSANTDGVLFKIPKARKSELDSLIAKWEKESGFNTEETQYKAVYLRDVNDYIAVKLDGKTKVKGTYAERGSALDSVLSKNPENLICSDALIALFAKGVPIVETINKCKDIRRFVTVRTVKGGACKDGIYLGKAIRWYYATEQTGEIIYAASGNKVPRSDGAKPLLDLPAQFPDDVNLAWYENEANEMLKEIGYLKPQVVDIIKPISEKPKPIFTSTLKTLPEPYYKDEYVTLYNGDSREILPLLPKAQLIVTDPPYGVDLNYDTWQDTEENWFGLMNDMMPLMIDRSQMLIVTACQIKRLGWFYKNFPPDWMICWHKGSTGHVSWIGFNSWEPLLVYGKTKGISMHDYFSVQNNEKMGARGHPCPKPEKWANWLIERTTKPGDLIIEPFCGSGTVPYVAKAMGRKTIAIEMSKDYCAIIAKRISQDVLF